jgi:hypothetical protein
MHVKGDFCNLGLACVSETSLAESCIKLLEERLEIFWLDFHEDIVCFTTDAVAVMQKVWRLFSCEYQLFFAHAVHLAVVDILYKKPKPPPKEQIIDNDRCDPEDE